jgi:nitric oxide reductase activation protein
VSSLTRHAGLVRRVRSRFERLRPRPVRLFRQIDGADVDISAYVTTVADRRAGLATDGRSLRHRGHASGCDQARRQGIAVFCLTVDREAPEYAGRIFGRAGFSVLEKAGQLPAVVVEVLRHLIRA